MTVPIRRRRKSSELCEFIITVGCFDLSLVTAVPPRIFIGIPELERDGVWNYPGAKIIWDLLAWECLKRQEFTMAQIGERFKSLATKFQNAFSGDDGAVAEALREHNVIIYACRPPAEHGGGLSSKIEFITTDPNYREAKINDFVKIDTLLSRSVNSSFKLLKTRHPDQLPEQFEKLQQIAATAADEEEE